MQWRNSPSTYGLVSMLLHWLVAAAVIVLFASGLWMVGLDYYSSWYRTAPAWHKGLGMLLLLSMVLRLAWRFASPGPAPLATPGAPARRLATLAHGVLYLLLFTVPLSGYFMSTAKGRPIDVFGWFEVPALFSGLPGQADLAGVAHEYLAWALVILAALHALAALKHHFIDRDPTLVRMLGRPTLKRP